MSSERVLCSLGETRDCHGLLSAEASGGIVQVVKANRVSLDDTEKNRVFVPSTESINSGKTTKTLKHARIEIARLNQQSGRHESGKRRTEDTMIQRVYMQTDRGSGLTLGLRSGRFSSPWHGRTTNNSEPIQDAGKNPFLASIAEELAGPIEDVEHDPFLISPRPSSESKVHIKASETQHKNQQQELSRTKPKLRRAVTGEPTVNNQGVVPTSQDRIPQGVLTNKTSFHPASASTPPLIRTPLATLSVENIRARSSTHRPPIPRRASAPEVTKSIDLLSDRLANLSLAGERANLENLQPGAEKRSARRIDVIVAIVEEEEPTEEQQAAVKPSGCTYYAPVPPSSQRSTGADRGGFILGMASPPKPSKAHISDLVAITEEDAAVIKSAPKAHTISKKRTHRAPFPAFSTMPQTLHKCEPTPFSARDSDSSERGIASRIPVMQHSGRVSLPELATVPHRYELLGETAGGPKVPTTKEVQ